MKSVKVDPCAAASNASNKTEQMKHHIVGELTEPWPVPWIGYSGQ